MPTASRPLCPLALIVLALLDSPARPNDAATLEYAHAVYRAHVEYRNGNTARSLALLDTCRAELRGWEWHYVNRLCRPESLTLPTVRPDGSKCSFKSAQYSPDGKFILTADGDNRASLWDSRTGAWVRSFTEETLKVAHAHFNRDGTRVLTSGDSTVATVWDAATAKPVLKLERKQRAIGAADWSRDGKRIITSGNRDLTLWDAATGKEIRTFASIAFYSCRPSFDRAGKRIVSNGFGASGTFDPETGNQLVRVKPGGNGTTNIARFHPDGARFVAAGEDGIARVHTSETGETLLELKGHKGGVASSAFSADGKRIVTASGDRTLRLWDAETGRELKVWQSTRGLLDAHFHPDGAQILSVEPGAVKVWRIAAEPVQLLNVEPGSWIIDVAFSPDGTQVAAGSTGKIGFNVDVWDVATGQVKTRLTGHDYVVHSVVYSPEGTRILTRTGTGRTKLWNAQTGAEILDIGGTGMRSFTIISGFNRDGTKLVSLKEGIVSLWDQKTGARLSEIKAATGIRSYWPGPGKGELTTLADGKLSRWDETTGKEKSVVTIDAVPKAVEQVWLVPGGTRLIVAERNGPVALWDALTGKKIRSFVGMRAHSEGMIAFTPDGARIAVATAGDNHVHILDAATGIELLAFPALPNNVGCLAFSPDGTRLLAGTSNDSPLRIHTGGAAPQAHKK